MEWVEEWSPGNGNGGRGTAKRKKIEFVGWASRPLLRLLESIGKDTTRPISHYDVTDIVIDYVKRNNLLHPTKKKRVVCDHMLLSLFGRKTISRIKIHELLDAHLAENQLFDDDDGDDYDVVDYEDEDDDETQHQPKKTKRTPISNAASRSGSCFAAIVPHNIRLVYLRRSLVERLLQQQQHGEVPESLEPKLVGSFVRIKADPNDYLQRNSHVLLPLKGIKKASETDGNTTTTTGFLLQVSGVVKDIQVSTLSDDYFTEEECEDLRQRIKDGLLKKPTVEELQQKAQTLHEDITKHIRKGGKYERKRNGFKKGNNSVFFWGQSIDMVFLLFIPMLFEYLERRQLLQTPSEQLRLLRELPKVTAEDLEPEVAPQHCADEVKPRNNSSSRSILWEASELPTSNTTTDKVASILTSGGVDSAGLPLCVTTKGRKKSLDLQQLTNFIADHMLSFGLRHDVSVQEEWRKEPTVFVGMSDGEAQDLNVKENNHQTVDKEVVRSQLINLSDDDDVEENEKPSSNKKQVPDDQLDSLIWHYQDPHGNTRGPFPITSLKRWNDADYFPPDFKIWKTGQSSSEAVLLSDILNRAFPI
ncbi:hypothetical protein FNV43_RR13877 [Rhamnella rubrinervis]|uniref:Uncharacterized protein n=1 Tax=Rhamnella rubrinervis TaxID=2594499 RepID=A0A8K0MFR7_9ROSA|nr:hypothetical protein FNV43_RR13877 [Rhamnella rubrinervis]